MAWTRAPSLVRGLDYYRHTAFEFVTDRLGAQGTVLGGGRYDGLMESLGGPPTPAVGWAAGIERLAMLVGNAPEFSVTIVMVSESDALNQLVELITYGMRRGNVVAEFVTTGSIQKRFDRAKRTNPDVILVFDDQVTGDNQIANVRARVLRNPTHEANLLSAWMPAVAPHADTLTTMQEMMSGNEATLTKLAS